MWALLVCVLVKPVEIANGLDLQHGTSAECLDVATDGKGGRPSTFVVEVTRTSFLLPQLWRRQPFWRRPEQCTVRERTAGPSQPGYLQLIPSIRLAIPARGSAEHAEFNLLHRRRRQYRECVSKFDRRRHLTPLSPCRSNSPRRIAY